MLDESTTDGVSVHESFLRGCWCPVRGVSFASLDVPATAFDGGGERGALGIGDRGAPGPEVVGGGAARTLGAGGGVGLGLSEGEVVGRPEGGAALTLGVAVSSGFQRSDAGFDGAIVPWRMGRRVQAKDAGGGQEVLELVGNESRSVIAFQDQRGAVANDQEREAGDSVLGAHRGDRSPEELLVTGEITDGEEIREDPIDGSGSLGEVDGPDGAGSGPRESVRGVMIAFPPDGTVADEQVVKFGARHVGESVLQGGQTGGGAEFVEHGKDRLPIVTRRTDCRTSERQRRRSRDRHWLEVGEPLTERAWGHVQFDGDVGERPAVLLLSGISEVNDAAAEIVFEDASVSLSAEAANRRRRGIARCGVAAMTEFDQPFHVFLFLPGIERRH